MSKSRIKINLPTINSRDDAEAVMNELALTANNRRKLIQERDKAVLEMNQRFEKALADCEQVIAESSDALRAWAEASPEMFSKGRKSLDLLSGTIGFRTGTPKLALLSRAWNWDKVLAAIESFAFQFTRTKTEVDKESILAFYAAGPDKAEIETRVLKPIGVKITQDESFFVEPNLTEMPTREVL